MFGMKGKGNESVVSEGRRNRVSENTELTGQNTQNANRTPSEEVTRITTAYKEDTKRMGMHHRLQHSRNHC